MPNTPIVQAEDWYQLPEGLKSEVGLFLHAADCEVVSYKADDLKAIIEASEDEAERERGLKYIKAAADAERVLGWTMSRTSRDRDRDRIRVAGWKLKNFRKNPVILYGHNYSGLPVGRSLRTWQDRSEDKLRGVLQFTQRELGGGFGFMIFELAREGYLQAGSVGFLPYEYERDERQDGEPEKVGPGFLFKSQELLEFSIVPVPSHPEALQEAAGKGISLAPYVPFAERILDHQDALPAGVKRGDLEVVYRLASPERATIALGEFSAQKSSEEPSEPARAAPPAPDRAAEIEAKMATAIMPADESEPAEAEPKERGLEDLTDEELIAELTRRMDAAVERSAEARSMFVRVIELAERRNLLAFDHLKQIDFILKSAALGLDEGQPAPTETKTPNPPEDAKDAPEVYDLSGLLNAEGAAS